MLSPYEPIDTRIENIINETPAVKTFVLKPKQMIGFSPGQFILLTVKGVGEAPFALSNSPYETGSVEVTAMNVGSLTDKLHHLKKADLVGIRGPYGNGFPVEKLYGRQLILIGGGMGIAPLRSLLLTLLTQKDRFKRVILCYGARTPQDVVYKDAFPRWMSEKNLEVYRSVENPDPFWTESEGPADSILDSLKADFANSIAIVCGPSNMMKNAVAKLIRLDQRPQDIYLSMERNMSCGLGKCGHCGIDRFYVCKDGPVFSYEEIKGADELWD